ncbi:MAG: hypothetical protein GKR97_02815 [Rhizobiaceae bacterium]|nr:hypothetical protein [Rhizobiaceae bacterium]
MLITVIRELTTMMQIVSNSVEKEYDANVVELASVPALITAYKVADMRLRLAIEQDREVDIATFGDQVDLLVKAMLEYDTTAPQERASLLRFLVDRFVLREDSSTELRRAVCDKLLQLA